MSEAVRERLEKSKSSFKAAELLLGEGYFSFAAGRAYYSMFYAVEALLLTRGLSFSRHSGVIAAFGKEFVKTGLFDPRFHRYFLHAFKIRNAADYGAIEAVDERNARQVIDECAELIAAMETYLLVEGPGA